MDTPRQYRICGMIISLKAFSVPRHSTDNIINAWITSNRKFFIYEFRETGRRREGQSGRLGPIHHCRVQLVVRAPRFLLIILFPLLVINYFILLFTNLRSSVLLYYVGTCTLGLIFIFLCIKKSIFNDHLCCCFLIFFYFTHYL